MDNLWNMTAQVVDLFPIGEQADDVVRRSIDALIAGRGLNKEVVADEIGMPRSTFYRKMAGRGAAQAFRAGEVASIARVLGVKVGVLYEGLGGTFVPPTPSGSLPRLDSNQEPFGFPFPQVKHLETAA